MIERLPESLICDYQYRMADFIYDTPRCACWVDLGLGKTIATLMALQRLLDDFETSHVLIIGPKRVARKVWTDEMQTWEHLREFDVQKIIGTADERLRAMNTRAEIHLINRENVAWLIDHFIQDRKFIRQWPWDTIVIDESTSFSYQSSGRFKALNMINKKVDRVIELTGTPDTRSLLGLWPQIKLLDGGARLGYSESAYHKKFFIPPNRYQLGNKHTPKHFAKKQIAKRLGDIVLTLRDVDYLDVKKPELNYVRVDMCASERKLYKQLEKEHILHFGDDIARAVNSGVLANKLLQICNGFIFTENPKYQHIHDRKIDALLELIEGLFGPVMVAYNYIPDRERIIKALKKAKVNFRLLKTEKDEDDWNAGKIDVLLFHPKSAGHGCNIHKSGSNNLIWMGLVWSLEEYLQVNARLVGGHRAGERKNVIHHIITEGTYEDRVRFTLTKNAKHQDDMKRATAAFVRSVDALDWAA